MGSMGATESDIKRWRRQGRTDILKWCSSNGPVGRVMGFPAGDLWINPRTGTPIE